MTTVESVFASAMGLMDELDPQGGAQSADTKDYERRAPAILNALCAELRTLTGEGSDWLPASGTEDLLPVEENYGLSALPYGLAETSADLDDAIATMAELLPKLLRLAEIEKACDLLADEIEKTRRRVNALEYVMIPQFEETIRSITMKLDENERGSLTRLMKVKEMIAERQTAES